MSSKAFSKTIIIGIDGMEPKIAEKLMKEKKLPNFSRLAREGTFSRLAASNPPHSPVAWTTLATGVNPGKHNIFDFIRINRENYMPELALAKNISGIGGTRYESFIKAVPFWKVLSDNKILCSIIRWPLTFPPEKINGRLLSGLGVPDVKGFLNSYTFYAARELSDNEKKTRKAVRVEEKEGTIKTEVFGPKMMKHGRVIDIKAGMTIKLEKDFAAIEISGKKHKAPLRNWSGWIKAEFKISILKKVTGIFKAYLKSTSPFEMLITSVQINPEEPIFEITYPKEFSRELSRQTGAFYTLGMPEETEALEDGVIDKEAFFQQIEEIEEERRRLFWKEFEEIQKAGKGCFAFVFDSSDRIQHMFWSEKEINPAIEDYYVQKDALLGEVLKKIDDKTLLLIFSDHGFTSFKKSFSLNNWLVQNGYMKLTAKPAESAEGALFQNVDWHNTQAYAVGFNSLYINVKGREKQGAIEHRKELVDELVKKLESIRNKKNKVIKKAYRREDIYSGDFVENAPDIIIGFNEGYRMSSQTAIGGFTKETISINDKKWKGDHLINPEVVPGVIFSNVKFNKKELFQTDIAPTIIKALGVTVPENMDGKSLI